MANLDPSLALLLMEKERFEKNPSLGTHPVPDNQEISIGIAFTGDYANIAALGFRGRPTPSHTAFGDADVPTLRALAAHPQVLSIDRHLPGHIVLDKSVPDIEANQVWSRSGNTFSGTTGKGVVVGIIDTGIDFTHPVFRDPVNPQKTRIKYIWDQTMIPGLKAPLPTEQAPDPISWPPLGSAYTINYGVEYNDEDIEATLANPDSNPPTCRHTDDDGHGTHVAGIAAGNGAPPGACSDAFKYIGVAPEATFVIVRKWGLTKGDTAVANPAGTDGNELLDAIAYVLDRAKTGFTNPMPVAVNLSLGRMNSSLMHSYNPTIQTIEDILNLPAATGIGVSFAAGNWGDKDMHAQDSIPAGGTLDIPWNIPASDKRERDFTLWYAAGSQIQISITSPAPTSETVTEANSSSTANGPGSAVSVASSPADGISNGSIKPGTSGMSLSGTWVIHVTNSGGAAVTVDGYCEDGTGKDGFCFHDNRPAQPGPPVLPLPVKTTSLSTMSMFACGKLSISTGAYGITDPANRTLTAFSSRGPTRDRPATAQKPDLCAPGENIHSAGHDKEHCSCCCACCQDWYVAHNGTSQASPHVAGTMALMLQVKPQYTQAQLRTALLDPASVNAPPGGLTPEDVQGWGVGAVDAKKAVQKVSLFSALVVEPATVQAPETEPSLQEELLRTPNGKSLAGLFQRYFPEVMNLINHNRRVATIWHRVKGPVWTRLAMQAYYNPALRLRPEIDGLSLTDAATKFLDILRQYASSALLGDIAPLEPLLAGFSHDMTLREMIDMVGHYKQEPAVWPTQPVH
ncbi:S8 family serine peptidase [Dinghuibacter silviterrae]|uniref:Subtilase family protein n=1 Tax=Dinghuibacter silviterrae TaxID=1539049 RepID=A0A4R8DKF4_9BACT|nr:S8 family serine peptidase [Dinghuibacter silviterrae]TDW97490.1 subtilase family protein [Dinghuibacter silviterrae]